MNSQIKNTNFEGETFFLVPAGLHGIHFNKSNYLMPDSVFKIESDETFNVPQRSVSRNLNVASGIYLIKIKSGVHIYGSLLKVD